MKYTRVLKKGGIFYSIFNTVFLLSCATGREASTDGELFCDKLWMQLGPECYIFEQDSLSWFDARDHCESLGGHLASIHSKEQQREFRLALQKAPIKEFWIGLNDIENESIYVWVDGTAVDYFILNSFVTDSPQADSKDEKDCVKLFGMPALWKDEACSKKRPFICKKKATMASNTSALMDPTLVSVCVVTVFLLILIAVMIYFLRPCLEKKRKLYLQLISIRR